MSHEVESMAWAVETPWHGLGVQVDRNISATEMLKAAGMDWTVERRELFTMGNDQRPIKIPGRRALVRSSDEKVLGTCGQDWKPVQNADILDYFDKYASAGGLTLETAGSLRGGTVVWALANLNHGFAVNTTDKVRGYLMMSTSHKPGTATTLRTTAVRVVCANTFAMAEAAGGINYKQSHVTTFDFSKAHEAAQQAHENLAHCAARAEAISKLRLSTSDSVKLLSKFFAEEQLTDDEVTLGEYDKKIQDIMFSVEHAPGAVPGTGWGLLNGVTHWSDHVAGRSNATRMFNAWMGNTAKLKLDVEDELYNMATV